MTLYLAPMAGITDWPFRLLCGERGCDFCTTEMVSAQGYITAPKKSRAFGDLVLRAPFEGPLLVQIFGHVPEYMAEAAKRLTDTGRFVGIDINMGCPAQKVTGSGSGSALLREPETVARVVRATVRATLLPVSVKLRLGWDAQSINAPEIAHIAEQEGAAMITVHGRTRMQQYAGHADYAQIARVKQAVRIPVIANGDVIDGASAREILRATGCDGIAVGRGALGRPWVFEQIKKELSGETFTPPTLSETLALAKRQAGYMSAWKGEHLALLEMRKTFAWYVKGFKGAARLRTKINTALTFDEVHALLDAFEAQSGEMEALENIPEDGKE